MATINGFTAEHMQAIKDGVIVSAAINGSGHLVFTKYDGSTLDVGSVQGPQGIQGPEGSVEEAPLTGDWYFRKDGAWEIINEFLPPIDGLKYAMRDRAWVRADRPWKLEFNNSGPTPPGGFVEGALTVGAAWYIRLSGSGYNVDYNFEFQVDGGATSSSARITLPSSLQPIVTHTGVAYITDTRSTRTGTGIAATRIDIDGKVKVAQRMQAVITEVGASIGEPSVEVIDGADSMFIQMSGSYTRASLDLPSTASYVGS